MYTKVELGGVGRSVSTSAQMNDHDILNSNLIRFPFLLQTSQIGTALAMTASVATVVALVIFPVVQKRYNNRTLFVFLVSPFVLVFALMPIGNLAARAHFEGDETMAKWKHDVLVWIAIFITLIPCWACMSANP